MPTYLFVGGHAHGRRITIPDQRRHWQVSVDNDLPIEVSNRRARSTIAVESYQLTAINRVDYMVSTMLSIDNATILLRSMGVFIPIAPIANDFDMVVADRCEELGLIDVANYLRGNGPLPQSTPVIRPNCAVKIESHFGTIEHARLYDIRLSVQPIVGRYRTPVEINGIHDDLYMGQEVLMNCRVAVGG